MKYRESKPSLRLAGVVKCFWSIENDADLDTSAEPVLPDGCPEVVFNLGDRFQRIHSSGSCETQPPTIVSGQLRKHILIRPTGRVELFGVRFYPHAGTVFHGLPMAELTDEIVSLDTVIGRHADELYELIAEAGTFEACVAAFETALMSAAAKMNGDHNLAGRLSECVIANSGRISVSHLRDSFGLTERRLERIFDRTIGLSPKMFTRIVRFQNVVRNVEMAESPDLLDAALSFGYYDQSHMIREFREFAGKSPLSYFEETHRISELFTTSV